jgi:hypothetical protein
MTEWKQFEAAAPDLGIRAREILSSTTNCVLATIRADGSPRVSGIDPFFLDGALYLGSMPNARKADDLRRDPRLALHGIPWESRRTKEGAPSEPIQADAKLTGRAVEVELEEAKRIMAWYWEQLGREAPDHGDTGDGPDGGHLFRVDVESVTLVSVEDEEFLVIDTWSERGGRNTVRRR